MIKINPIKLIAAGLTFSAIILTQSVFAQKYQTAADTIKLNKEYGEVTLDLSKLNTNLIAEQNKTAGYQAKTISARSDAAASAQRSKETAAIATNASTSDAKKALKEAKKADKDARDSRDAKNDEDDNMKKIAEINAKIIKKQAVLADLAKQKAAIIAASVAVTPKVAN